jgi:thiamine-monophosphate kinase
MAADPLGVLLAVTLPDAWRADLAELAAGVGEAAAAAGARIVGGDTTRGGELSLGVTVLGVAARPLARSGARPGDAIYVTGTFGGPAAAVRAWMRGDAPAPAHRERFARPVARIREGARLAEAGARAAVDISDGLLADLAHIAAASGACLVVALDELPVMEGVGREEAARGGEEYELAVAAPETLDHEALARELGVPLTRIGRVERGAPEVRATLHGERVASGGGWDHLS